jgi:hypothetical protein
MRNRALRNLKDVSAYSQLPVLGGIPLFEGRGAIRRRKRLAWLAWSTLGLTGVLVMSISVAHYYLARI